MEPYVAELIGVAAAAASLYAAHAKTMVPLRAAAIVGNILAMAYSFMLGTYPIFMLNAAFVRIAWVATAGDAEPNPRHRRCGPQQHERRLAASLYAPEAFQG